MSAKNSKSKNFKFEVFNPKQTKNKSIIRQTIRVRRHNGNMTYADVKTYFDDLVKKLKIDSDKIAIGGMTEKYYTIKGFADDDLKPWDDDEYYQDRAKDGKKFNEYEFVDFMIEK